MKYPCVLLALACTMQLNAQKQSPHWAAGMYGGVATGFSVFTQPFKNSTAPFVYFASSGFSVQADAGMSFRNHWGLRAMVGSHTASDFRLKLQQNVAQEYPGHVLSYFPEAADNRTRALQFGLGLSYAFAHQRWNIQPEVLVGATQAYSEWPTLHVKEVGTHDIVLLQYTPTAASYRSLCFSLGSRAAWYAGWYWGFFADARLNGTWYQLPFRQIKTDLIEHSTQREDFNLKKTAFGGSLNLGIFLQIARWEAKSAQPVRK